MKNLIIYIALSLSLISLSAQSPSGGLWFMPEVYQANRLNPAFSGDRKLVIGLPGSYLGIANSAFALQDILNSDGSVDLGLVFNNIDDQNYIRSWVDIQGIALGLNVGKAQIGADWHIRTSGYLRYSDRMAQLFWYGNGPFVDETIQILPDLQLSMFSEVALRFNMPILDKLEVGGSLKFLQGIADVSTSRNDASLYTDPEYYQITIEADYQIDASAISDIDDFAEIVQDPSRWQMDKGSGVALDLGANFKLNDQWSFAASLIDIGQVNWKGEVTNAKVEGNFTYEGVPIGRYSEADSGLSLGFFTDSLKNAFSLEQSNNPYRTNLPSRFLIGATWEPISILRLGVLYEREWYRGQNFDLISLHGGLHLKDNIYAGMTYTLQETFQNRLGGQVMAKLGPVQVYASTGNLLTLLRYMEGKTADVRIGANLVFGKER